MRTSARTATALSSVRLSVMVVTAASTRQDHTSLRLSVRDVLGGIAIRCPVTAVVVDVAAAGSRAAAQHRARQLIDDFEHGRSTPTGPPGTPAGVAHTPIVQPLQRSRFRRYRAAQALGSTAQCQAAQSHTCCVGRPRAALAAPPNTPAGSRERAPTRDPDEIMSMPATTSGPGCTSCSAITSSGSVLRVTARLRPDATVGSYCLPYTSITAVAVSASR